MKDNQSLYGILQVLLPVLFIGLKLGDVIAWSWWWVLSPLWIPWVIVLGLAIVIITVAFIVAVVREA